MHLKVVQLSGTCGVTILMVKVHRTAKKEYANDQGTPLDASSSYCLLSFWAKSLLT